MNVKYLEQATARVPDVPLLINMVSRRVRQLIAGERPLVKPDDVHMEKMDIALREIGEGKLTSEMLPEQVEAAQTEPSRSPSLLGSF